MMDMPEGWKRLKEAAINIEMENSFPFGSFDKDLELIKEMAEALEKQYQAGVEYHECYSTHSEIKAALQKFRKWK